MIEQLRTLLSDESLELVLTPRWGAHNEGHRQLIRQSLFECLKAKGDSSTHYSRVMSLETPPTSEVFAVSIAHSNGLGGFVLSQKARSIGLDVEDPTRVTEAAVSRISNSADALTKSPGATHLWVALEASYKAFARLLSLKTLSQLNVSDWEERSPHIWAFKARSISDTNSAFARGLVFESEGHLAAISAVFA